jgi:hypothetical protein
MARKAYINWKRLGYDDLLNSMTTSALVKKINDENPGRSITLEDIEKRKDWLLTKNEGGKRRIKKIAQFNKYKYEEVLLDNTGHITRDNISYCLADFCMAIEKDNWELVNTYRIKDSMRALFRCPAESYYPLFPKEKTKHTEDDAYKLIQRVAKDRALMESSKEVCKAVLEHASNKGFNENTASEIFMRFGHRLVNHLLEQNLVSSRLE